MNADEQQVLFILEYCGLDACGLDVWRDANERKTIRKYLLWSLYLPSNAIRRVLTAVKYLWHVKAPIKLLQR